MARDQNLTTPPAEQHPVLILLMCAFNADSKGAIKGLMMEAFTVIYGGDFIRNGFLSSKKTLNLIIRFVMRFRPKTEREALQAAQFVVCHLLGVMKLGQKYREDQKLAMKFLHFCNRSLWRDDAHSR